MLHGEKNIMQTHVLRKKFHVHGSVSKNIHDYTLNSPRPPQKLNGPPLTKIYIFFPHDKNLARLVLNTSMF